MKKFTYLATMLLVMAGAVSCEKKSDVKNPESKLQPTGEMREVSVAAGQGATKTSVNNGVLTWSEGDKLYVAPTAGGIDAAVMNITSGVGTASGMFHGRVDSAIEDETTLYGWAGGAWTYSNGAFTVNMPETQTYVENGLAENAYPSIGTGTIKGGVSLQNPFGVLSLNVKGKDTDAVKSITVTSATKNIAGDFTVDPSTLAVSGGSSKTITLTFTDAVSLTSDGVRFYMVFPVAEYPAGDLTVTVTKTDDTTIEVSLGAITVAAGNATAKQNVKEPLRPECQSALDADANWVKIGGKYWLNVNTKCIEYDTKSEAFKAGITIIPSGVGGYDPFYTDYTTVSRPSYMTEAQFNKLGLLYNWAAAVGLADGRTQTTAFSGKRQGICPNGSHIPSMSEWDALQNSLGGASTAGRKMKTSTGWQYFYGQAGEGDNGFAALPAGRFMGEIQKLGQEARYWTSDVNDSESTYAYGRFLMYVNSNLDYYSWEQKTVAESVRCIKD